MEFQCYHHMVNIWYVKCSQRAFVHSNDSGYGKVLLAKIHTVCKNAA